VFGEDCGGVWVALEFDAAEELCFVVLLLLFFCFNIVGYYGVQWRPQVGQTLLPLFLLSYLKRGEGKKGKNAD
jgi:hypothetical protein